MQSVIEKDAGRVIILKTTLLLVAITVNAFEMFLPRIPFLPWLKPGFANCVTIVWIIRYGGVDALFFSMLRIWLVGFYFGFSFITLSLSMSGGILATCAMGILWYALGRRGLIGVIGIAVTGAVFHNFGQLTGVYFLLAYNPYLFYQVPFMIGASLLFGSIVGVLSQMLDRLSYNEQNRIGDMLIPLPENRHVSGKYSIISVIMLGLSISLVFIDSRTVLIIFAILITSMVQVVMGGSLNALFFPIRRFWLMFIFVACLLLFLPYGKKMTWMPWITYEGVEATSKQWLRLWTWLQISFIFTRFNFHHVVFRALNSLFKSKRSTLYAGLLAVEDFPAVFDLMRKRITLEFKAMLTHPLTTSKNALMNAFHDVADHIVGKHSKSMEEEKG